MTTLSYNDGAISIDTAHLPEASVTALLQRGVNHLFGNETASRVSQSIRKQINPEAPSEVSTDEIKVFRKENEDAVEEMTRKAHADFMTALANGTLGVRAASGTTRTVDPVERELRSLAQAQAMEILRSSGAIPAGQKKQPKADDVFTFGADQLTFAALVGRVIASGKYGPTLRKQAEAVVRAKARAVESAGEGAASLEEMGL